MANKVKSTFELFKPFVTSYTIRKPKKSSYLRAMRALNKPSAGKPQHGKSNVFKGVIESGTTKVNIEGSYDKYTYMAPLMKIKRISSNERIPISVIREGISHLVSLNPKATSITGYQLIMPMPEYIRARGPKAVAAWRKNFFRHTGSGYSPRRPRRINLMRPAIQNRLKKTQLKRRRYIT